MTVGQADPPPNVSDSRPASSSGPMEPTGRPGLGTTRTQSTKVESAGKPANGLDNLKIPTDAILVICKEVKDALDLVPDGIVLSLARYQALLDRIEQLERLRKPAPTEMPTRCQLSGQVDGDVVRFQVKFEFRTDRPRAVVALGCQRAWLKPGATLDGQLPLLLAGDDGSVKVQVEMPGVHQATLELEAPLGSKGVKGSEQGFEFGLPRAAITILDQFTLPHSLQEIRVNGRAIRTKPEDGGHSKLEGIPLGPAERLDIAWKASSGPALTEALVLEAVGRIVVKVDDSSLVTDVELTLQALGGEARQWSIQMPADVIPEIKEPRPQDERLQSIELMDPKKPVLKIELREANSAPLKVHFQIRETRPKTTAAIGPFQVPGALRQRGTIVVIAPPDSRLRFRPRADVVQREVADESRRDGAVAEFTYGNLPITPKPAPAPPALLVLDIEDVKGVVETSVEHYLILTEAGWQAAVKIQVKPFRTRVDRLDVDLPVAFQYDRAVGPSPSDLVDSVELVNGARGFVAQVKLFREQSQPFVITLTGLYPLLKGVQQASLELPKPIGRLERGGQIVLSLPEGIELARQESRPDVPGHWLTIAGTTRGADSTPLATERQLAWRCDRFPSRLELSWHPFRPDLLVNSVVDLTLTGRLGLVRQQLKLQFPRGELNHISLVIPDSLGQTLGVVEGGTITGNGQVKLHSPGDREHTLILGYSFPLFESRMAAHKPGVAPFPVDVAGFSPLSPVVRVSVPLVAVSAATRSDTRVRVWSAPGIVPTVIQGPWREERCEIVPDRDALPGLVIGSNNVARAGDTIPLVLSLNPSADFASAPVIVDRALIQATVAESGLQKLRARFVVSRLNVRQLDVQFPFPLARSSPELFLDGKRVTRVNPLDAANDESEGSATARIDVEPDLYRKPLVLEARYQFTPATGNGLNAWITSLQPPVPRSAVVVGRVRWQVELPLRWIAPYHGNGSIMEQQWTWRGGLLTPEPAPTNADLERWLMSENRTDSLKNGDQSADEWQPSLVCWQTVLTSLPLVLVPQPVWLLGWSILFLVFGLVLGFAPLSRGKVWIGVFVLFSASVGGALWSPELVPAVLYGCEPGFMVFACIWVVQWLLQRRYRRQVVFLPSFTRLKTGSSLVRRESNRPRGEPSTVDAPAKRESSAKKSSEIRNSS
jgi:hypothetical protein